MATPKSTSLSTVNAEVLKGKPSNSKELRDQARNEERWNKPKKPNGKKPDEDCRNAWSKLTNKQREEDHKNRTILEAEGGGGGEEGEEGQGGTRRDKEGQ